MQYWKLTFKSTVFFSFLFTLIALAVEIPDVFGYGIKTNLDSMARFIRTAICALAALSLFPVMIDKRSKYLMTGVFSMVLIADYFLILEGHLITGILFFAAMQILLIIRNLKGHSFRFYKIPVLRNFTILILLFCLGANVFLWPQLSEKQLALPVLCYSLLLCISVIIAFATKFQDAFPSVNAKYVFHGMLLFLICDITIGIGVAFSDHIPGQFVGSLTGLAYTPALLYLLASALPWKEEVDN